VCLTVPDLSWSVPVTKGITPSARNNHSTFVHGSRLYIHGGHDGRRWLADFWCLDTESLTWTVPEVSGLIPSARACHTITLAGTGKGKAYLFGGYDGSKCFSDLDVLDLETMVRAAEGGCVPAVWRLRARRRGLRGRKTGLRAHQDDRHFWSDAGLRACSTRPV
jgi:hypothetical protein